VDRSFEGAVRPCPDRSFSLGTLLWSLQRVSHRTAGWSIVPCGVRFTAGGSTKGTLPRPSYSQDQLKQVHSRSRRHVRISPGKWVFLMTRLLAVNDVNTTHDESRWGIDPGPCTVDCSFHRCSMPCRADGPIGGATRHGNSASSGSRSGQTFTWTMDHGTAG
jgi:hypothetical protein